MIKEQYAVTLEILSDLPPKHSIDKICAQHLSLLSSDNYPLDAELESDLSSVPEAVHRSDSRFELATQVTQEGIWDLNCRSGRMFCSLRLREMLGFSAGTEPRHLRGWIRRIYRRDLVRLLRQWTLSRVRLEKHFEAEFRCADVNGDWRWLRTRAITQRDSTGEVLRIVGTASDITVQRQTDPLTGLHNRPSLLEHLQWRIERAGNESRNFALYFLDLDSFKSINDTLGHASGDSLLIGVAKRIAETLPASSTSVAARIGGDEFVVLVDDLAAEPDAIMFGKLLRHILNAPYTLSRPVTITASIGIAFGSPDRLLTAEQMLEEADIAMYEAKTSGKADCVLYAPPMRQEIERRVNLKRDLTQAVEKNELELHYQPIVDIAAGAATGVEVLLRWRHPERGLIEPAEFISTAEDSGLIGPIGDWVFRESVETLSGWITNDLVPEAFKCSINVSVRQLQEPELMSGLLRLCEEAQLAPDRLRLEITESALMQNLPTVTAALQVAVEAGIGLDLDDFGTGFSSLSYLQDFPFHCMKIDGSFTKRLAADLKSRTLVSTIVCMAHSLGMEVIAEGVETEEQAALVSAMGCKQSQGYLYSRPLPKQAFEQQWLLPAHVRATAH